MELQELEELLRIHFVKVRLIKSKALEFKVIFLFGIQQNKGVQKYSQDLMFFLILNDP